MMGSLAMLHSVQLEASSAPLFPACCVVCLAAEPDATLKISALFNHAKPLDEAAFAVHQTAVPVCSSCSATLQRSRWFGKFVFAVAIAVSALLIALLSQFSPVWLEGWLSYVVLALLLFGPIALSMLLYTPHFDFGVAGRRHVFEFRSRDYAERFAELNDAQID